MNLAANLKEKLGSALTSLIIGCEQEVTLETTPVYLHALCKELKQDSAFQFDMLIDVCGVDYLDYGTVEWETRNVTETGFSRGVEKEAPPPSFQQPSRFAVVYHLLSTVLNQRVRVRVFLEEEHLIVDSVSDIWPAASWFEREAYDLYGILFKGHPDLRRILTDYGFIGYPFRKDFPLSGHVEVRYDANTGRVVNMPVDIQPRTLVPKTRRMIQEVKQKEEASSSGN